MCWVWGFAGVLFGTSLGAVVAALLVQARET